MNSLSDAEVTEMMAKTRWFSKFETTKGHNIMHRPHQSAQSISRNTSLLHSAPFFFFKNNQKKPNLSVHDRSCFSRSLRQSFLLEELEGRRKNLCLFSCYWTMLKMYLFFLSFHQNMNLQNRSAKIIDRHFFKKKKKQNTILTEQIHLCLLLAFPFHHFPLPYWINQKHQIIKIFWVIHIKTENLSKKTYKSNLKCSCCVFW